MIRLDVIPALRLCLALLLWAASAVSAAAYTATAAWNPSPSPGVTGYYLYYGASGSFTNRLAVGNQTSTTISGLQGSVTYFFYVTATDGTIESAPSSVVNYHVNTAPTAANVSAQTIANQSTLVALLGSDPDGDKLTYSIVVGPAHGALSGVIPNLIYTPAAGYSGSDSFTYKVNDGQFDSNIANASISVMPSVDSVAPTVAISAPVNGSVRSGVVTINVDASDNVGVSGIELYLNGALAGAAASAPVSFNWDTTTVANGTWIIVAKAYDLSGNVGTSTAASVSIQNTAADVTPPTVSLVSPTADSTVSGLAQIQIAASDNVAVAKVKCLLNGALLGSTTTFPAVFSWDTTKYLDGSYVISAQAYDTSGNSTALSVRGITVANLTTAADATAPIVLISSPSVGAVVWGASSVKVQATDDRGVTKVELYVDAKLVDSATSGYPTFSLDTTTLANGAHTLEVRGYDAAGNVGRASVQVDVENAVGPQDTTAPSVVITSPRNGATAKSNFFVQISSSDNAGVTSVELYLDGKLYGSSTSENPSFSVSAAKLSKGTHNFVAKAYDAAGNQGVSATVSVRR